jgi:hypothetical protein
MVFRFKADSETEQVRGPKSVQAGADEGKQRGHHSALLFQNWADGTALPVHAHQYGGNILLA